MIECAPAASYRERGDRGWRERDGITFIASSTTNTGTLSLRSLSLSLSLVWFPTPSFFHLAVCWRPREKQHQRRRRERGDVVIVCIAFPRGLPSPSLPILLIGVEVIRAGGNNNNMHSLLLKVGLRANVVDLDIVCELPQAGVPDLEEGEEGQIHMLTQHRIFIKSWQQRPPRSRRRRRRRKPVPTTMLLTSSPSYANSLSRPFSICRIIRGRRMTNDASFGEDRANPRLNFFLVQLQFFPRERERAFPRLVLSCAFRCTSGVTAEHASDVLE